MHLERSDLSFPATDRPLSVLKYPETENARSGSIPALPLDMSVSVVGEAAIRRAAEQARRSGRSRLSTDDLHDSQEHRAHQPARPGVGVLAALAQAGIRLTLDQRRGIERVIRVHIELATQPFTPSAAVERLLMHGIHFTDHQLELVADERSVSGFRRLESGFEDIKTTASHPAYRPSARTVQIEAQRRGGFVSWLLRVFGMQPNPA